MAAIENSKLAQLPDEMFTIIRAATYSLGPRLGRLSVPGRKVIETPHYLATTSRGVVPHLSQDNFARETSISAVYVGLEDFIERSPRQVPPIYKFRPPDGSSPLRSFIALPDETLLVFGPRRTPPVAAPNANPNTNTTIAVSTAVGFKSLSSDEYIEQSEQLRPDVIVGLGDVPYQRALGSKRIEKATDRSIQWMQEHIALRASGKEDMSLLSLNEKPKLFAPLLPVSCANQQFYIDCLTQELSADVSGLAFFDLTPLEDLPVALNHFPRLAFTEPSTPRQVFRQVAAGIDVVTIPFVNVATDAGIALDFTFPPPEAVDGSEPVPLGVDMWLSSHATDLSPLQAGCKCYACTSHHRAYLQHLLSAKEMLGWVLLQIHNYHTIDRFFTGIRRSITNGTFEKDMQYFARAYEPELPERTGQGPRVRGYQQKSIGRGEPKINNAPFTALKEGEASNAETPVVPDSSADASELEGQGFAETEK